MSRKQIDILLNKWISRKLLVFLIATIGLFFKLINSTDWTIISTAYIGIEGFTNIVERVKNNNITPNEY